MGDSQSGVVNKAGVRQEQDTVSNFDLRSGAIKNGGFLKLLSTLELDFDITPSNSKKSVINQDGKKSGHYLKSL